jgi:hypothetical protein
MLHHKQTFSNNAVEANENKVHITTNFAHSAGPAITVLSGTLSLVGFMLFVALLIKHFNEVVSVITILFYLAAGSVSVWVVCMILTQCWIMFSHAKAEHVFSSAQNRRNAVFSVGVNHVAYDSNSGVAVAKLAEKTTNNYRDEAPIVESEALAKLGTAPTMSEVMKNHLVSLAQENRHLLMTDKRFCMGYTLNGPRFEKFGNVRSIAIGGKNGTGKTSTIAFFSLQAVLYGFQLVIIDPHIGNPESIANKLEPVANFMVRPAASQAQLVDVLSAVNDELENRKLTPSTVYQPWVIVLDELPAMIRKAKGTDGISTIINAIAAINDEGRKYGMFMIAGGQRWKQSSSGSADVRQSFPAVITHKNSLSEVALLMDCTPSEATLGTQLSIGQVYINDSVESMMHTAIPFVAAQDAPIVARVAESFRNFDEMPTNVIEMPRKISEMPEIVSEIPRERSWEDKLALFRELHTQKAKKVRYMNEIWGAKAGDNEGYNTFKREFAEMSQIVCREIEEEEESWSDAEEAE